MMTQRSDQELARQRGVSQQAIGAARRRRGEPTPAQAEREARWAKVESRWHKLTDVEISAMTGFSQPAVSKRRKAYGIPGRPPGRPKK